MPPSSSSLRAPVCSLVGLWALAFPLVGGCERHTARELDRALARRVPLAPVCEPAKRGAPDPGPALDLADGGPTRFPGGIRVGVIGDYGYAGAAEAAVARLVDRLAPDFVVTTGDNNYPSGSAETIDANIGQYYHHYIGDYHGAFGCRPAENRFFPSLGNHDWLTTGAQPYFAYFRLPGNERYYDFVRGPVHFFALDSDANEPDGISATSAQALWLKVRLAASTSPWRVVYLHHAPYSSGPHASQPATQWPFKDWGVDLVLAGHDHDYERINVDGLPYVVCGLGGASIYEMGEPVEGSKMAFQDAFGAGVIDADEKQLRFRFYAATEGTAAGTKPGALIDELVLTAHR